MIEECTACGWLLDYGMCGCPDGRPVGPLATATACPTCRRFGCICSPIGGSPTPAQPHRLADPINTEGK